MYTEKNQFKSTEQHPIKHSESGDNIFAAKHRGLTLNRQEGGSIMKKPMAQSRSLFLLLIVPLMLLIAAGCKEKSLPTFVKVEYGGCNNQTEFPDNRSTIDEIQNDTIIFELQDGILKITVGINYICCADFNATQNINDDGTISLTMTDTTASQEEYCRCECYYVFVYYFTDLHQKSYKINAFIKSPDGSIIKQISQTFNIN